MQIILGQPNQSFKCKWLHGNIYVIDIFLVTITIKKKFRSEKLQTLTWLKVVGGPAAASGTVAFGCGRVAWSAAKLWTGGLEATLITWTAAVSRYCSTQHGINDQGSSHRHLNHCGLLGWRWLEGGRSRHSDDWQLLIAFIPRGCRHLDVLLVFKVIVILLQI